jgi:hypothetical protein
MRLGCFIQAFAQTVPSALSVVNVKVEPIDFDPSACMVHRPSAVPSTRLRRRAQAAVSLVIETRSGTRGLRASRARMDCSIPATFSQLPCSGVQSIMRRAARPRVLIIAVRPLASGSKKDGSFPLPCHLQ